MTDDTPTLTLLVRTLKSAIEAVQDDLATEGLTISQAELSLKVAVKKEGTVGTKFKLLVVDVDLSATINRQDVKTITLTLIPARTTAEMLRRVDEDLRQAIGAIGEAVHEAAAAPPVFDLDKATVELNFAATEQGKVLLFAFAGGGGGGSNELIHTLKLTLKRA